MRDQRFTPQQRWILGLVAGGSFIAALDGMVVTDSAGRHPPRSVGADRFAALDDDSI